MCFATFATSSGKYYASNEKTDGALQFFYISSNFSHIGQITDLCSSLSHRLMLDAFISAWVKTFFNVNIDFLSSMMELK